MQQGSEVPEGWATAKIGELFTDWGGITPSTSNPDYWNGEIPWVSSKDVKQLRISDSADHVTLQALEESRLRLCPKGSVLVVVRSGILRHTLPVSIADAEVTINQDLKAFYSPHQFLNEWLALTLRARSTQILTQNRKDGTTVQSIRVDQLRKMDVLLPPLAEQHRIVAAIEALFARLDAANARLERVPGILKQFRQAVLAAACDGRLTEDWRQTNVVFECEADYLASSRAILNNEELSPAFSHTVQKDLPSMWRHVAFGSLGDWKSGATPSKSNSDFWTNGQIPWVSPKDMKTEAITNSIDHITMEAVEKTNLHILPKDSLIFVVRGMILARDFPIALTEHEVTINQDMRALIPSGCVYPRYLLRALQDQAHHMLRAVRSSTHGTKRLESPTLKTWPIALPPFAEQHEIVRRVDALFALANKIEAEVATAREKTEKMRQSILAQAFSGRLVPTEAELARREGREYEPASVLLERIRSGERAKKAGKESQSTLT